MMVTAEVVVLCAFWKSRSPLPTSYSLYHSSACAESMSVTPNSSAVKTRSLVDCPSPAVPM